MSYYRYEKSQRTIHKAPEGKLTSIVEAIRSFLYDLRSREPSFSEKKRYLPGDKTFWATFPRIIECDRPQGTICKGPKSTVTITVEVIRSFPYHLRSFEVVENTNFE